MSPDNQPFASHSLSAVLIVQDNQLYTQTDAQLLQFHTARRKPPVACTSSSERNVIFWTALFEIGYRSVKNAVPLYSTRFARRFALLEKSRSQQNASFRHIFRASPVSLALLTRSDASKFRNTSRLLITSLWPYTISYYALNCPSCRNTTSCTNCHRTTSYILLTTWLY